ncbi:mitotic checkpoint serine/threonine-protein kinase BUB1 isoform X2 [Aristolochia californica]|uniref:mitotic checkpoint serine/threonine-protein kinase BUB1 isoform X2 n=1 Tax=Aristolochia californica TaxID=171875 RepID=UPI0035E35330
MVEAADDPLYPWLCTIMSAYDDYRKNPGNGTHLETLLERCVNFFQNDDRYKNDIRFLKIWIIHADMIQDFDKVFKLIEGKKMFLCHSLLYESYAIYLEAKGSLLEAHRIYQLGITRKAEPLETLKKMHALFLARLTRITKICSKHEIDIDESVEHADSLTRPWSASVIKDLLEKIKPRLLKYKGYHATNKAYIGKVPLPSLKNVSRNKVIELGGKKYQIIGCSGTGAYAQVFKAYVDRDPGDVVALKIQRPAFPWEFYMYRQLDQRISDVERASFGFAHRAHVYSDCSVIVSDYLAHGTLQDAINCYVVTGQSMEEVLCMYYTTEMLRMLENLHSVEIIHGDFKPDNLLVRYSSDELTEDGFLERAGPWSHQGLCLVDWGRGIDLRLFPDGTKFKGDCRTSGFRCVEMQENRPWSFQADTYGLCVIVHMMLHGSYMTIEKKAQPDGSCVYKPRSSLKRYWNIDLWNALFMKLLNIGSIENDTSVLQSLRESFENYFCGTPALIKKLKQLLVKQRASLCSAR